jgi:hypothetical protein
MRGVGAAPLRNRSLYPQIEVINQLDVLPFPVGESVYIPPANRSFMVVCDDGSLRRPATLTAGFSPTGGTLQGISADD